MTYRPKNECDDCGYTWYPRGKNRSLRCPHCGSRDIIKYETRYTTDWWPLKFLVILFVSFIIAMKAQEAKNDVLTNMAMIGCIGGAVGFTISYARD